MNYKLNKMKNELKTMRKEDNPCIPSDDIMEFISHLSKEAAKDIMENGYDPKTGELIYSKLKTITLAEIVGPEAKALVIGTGEDTVALIDDVSDMED